MNFKCVQCGTVRKYGDVCEDKKYLPLINCANCQKPTQHSVNNSANIQ